MKNYINWKRRDFSRIIMKKITKYEEIENGDYIQLKRSDGVLFTFRVINTNGEFIDVKILSIKSNVKRTMLKVGDEALLVFSALTKKDKVYKLNKLEMMSEIL